MQMTIESQLKTWDQGLVKILLDTSLHPLATKEGVRNIQEALVVSSKWISNL